MLSESHEDSVTANHDSDKRHSARSGLVTGVLWVAAVLLVILLLAENRNSRTPARRSQCMLRLKQIGISLLQYHSDYGVLPPAYTVDDEGNRLHSWRTLILPYIGEADLYSMIDLSKPWDNPSNAIAREAALDAYRCPSATHTNSLTTYLAIVGPDCAFRGSHSRTLAEITDGLSSTMVVFEAPSDRAVHWMSPNDISDEDLLLFGSNPYEIHAGITNALFLDCHVEAIPQDANSAELRAWMTIAGGEEVEY